MEFSRRFPAAGGTPGLVKALLMPVLAVVAHSSYATISVTLPSLPTRVHAWIPGAAEQQFESADTSLFDHTARSSVDFALASAALKLEINPELIQSSCKLVAYRSFSSASAGFSLDIVADTPSFFHFSVDTFVGGTLSQLVSSSLTCHFYTPFSHNLDVTVSPDNENPYRQIYVTGALFPGVVYRLEFSASAIILQAPLV